LLLLLLLLRTHFTSRTTPAVSSANRRLLFVEDTSCDFFCAKVPPLAFLSSADACTSAPAKGGAKLIQQPLLLGGQQ
jgi:hypothetical protein